MRFNIKENNEVIGKCVLNYTLKQNQKPVIEVEIKLNDNIIKSVYNVTWDDSLGGFTKNANNSYLNSLSMCLSKCNKDFSLSEKDIHDMVLELPELNISELFNIFIKKYNANYIASDYSENTQKDTL